MNSGQTPSRCIATGVPLTAAPNRSCARIRHVPSYAVSAANRAVGACCRFAIDRAGHDRSSGAAQQLPGRLEDDYRAVNAVFFALAFSAAANPKLLALDLVLINNRRPRLMFMALLTGGLSVAIAVGLVDVLVVHAGAVNSQKKVAAGVDLAIGLALLGTAALLLTGVLPRRHRGQRAPAQPTKMAKAHHDIENWAQRALSEPRPWLALLVGVIIGLPGASYLIALHDLQSGHYSTATQVVAVVVFVVIEFLVIIIAFLFLQIRPVRTATFLKHWQAWLIGHAKQLIVAICLALGGFLTISALVRLA